MITWDDITTPENTKATAYALVGGDYQAMLESFTAPSGGSALYPTMRLLAARYHPRRYLEIGVYRGRSAVVVATGYPPVEIVGIDNWANPKSLGSEEARRYIWARHPAKLTLLTGDSRELVTPALGMFDLILIDGGHGLDVMEADLNASALLLSPGGHLVAHDIFASHVPARVDLWERFKAQHPDWEWLERKIGPGIGIGKHPSETGT